MVFIKLSKKIEIMIEIEFLQDFANKKKGTKKLTNKQLAFDLIKRGVAKYTSKPIKKVAQNKASKK